MADLKQKITAFPAACTVEELERFSDLFARTINENHCSLDEYSGIAG